MRACITGSVVKLVTHLSLSANTPWLEGGLVSQACLWSRQAYFTLQILGGFVISHIRQYIGYHCWYLFQHNMEPMNLKDHFTILRKCRSNLDCLRYESHTSDILKPVVNTQSCRAKLFFNEHFISLKVFCHLIRLIVDPFTMQILSYYLIVNDIRR